MDGSSSLQATGSPMAEMLTPRSKVAKLLADIDNALTPSPSQRVADAEASIHALGVADLDLETNELPRVTANSAEPLLDVDDSDGDDDLDVPVRRPQGRAARRMLELRNESPTASGRSAIQPKSSPPRRQSLHASGDDEDLYSATPLQLRAANRDMSGSPIGSEKSAALSVSPAKSAQQEGSDEDELPGNLIGSKEKLAELVARKREERLRREGEERAKLGKGRKKRNQSPSPSAHASSDLPGDVLDNSQQEQNPEIERIMSDAARPTRKASKKALFEMERETQRLARQQALAHQMKVKKKFTTSDLFARFNFHRPQDESLTEVAAGESTASSAPNSDAPESGLKEPVSTPPSSPPTADPTPLDKQKALVEQGALSKLVPVREDSIASLAHMLDDHHDELPDISVMVRSSQATRETAVVEPQPSPIWNEQSRKGLKLARFGKKAVARPRDDSSDDDLEIIAPLPPHLRAFDKVKLHDKNTQTDSKALHTLRHLSHIGAYDAVAAKSGKGRSRPSIGPKALEVQLRRKAKDQARLQQQERIADLKAKGVIIQSAEEQEREAEVFENLLERARQEAQVLRKAEKAEANEGGLGGKAVDASDDQEDEEYVGSESEEAEGEDGDGEEDEYEGEIEGPVDEAAEETDEEENEGRDDVPNELADEAENPDAADAHADEPALVQPNMDAATPASMNRKARRSRVIKDDDDNDDSDAEDKMAQESLDLATVGAADDDDPFAAFNFEANGGSDDALLSPTQAFQATMQTPTQATQEDSFDILRKIVPPSMSSLPPMIPKGYGETQPTQQEESQASVVPGGKVPESQRLDLAWETQPPETPTIGTLQHNASGLTETQGWEPTQDAGLPSPWTLGLRRESTIRSMAEDDDTQSTVRLRVSESPAASAAHMPRRGRLVRRQAAVLVDSSEDEEIELPEKVAKKDAFREMARRRKEALTRTERADAAKEMKQMLEEQAEESEDEYAGLGGDDFVAPETDADREMIDSSHIDVDERQLAKLFAEKQRQREEEETSRLYKDLTTGALSRKQANRWGLEEDEDEIAMRRRQMRQLEEARKRKLLLQDDNIAGLAQGKQSKGKDAFLKAIADDDAGDEMFDLSDGDEENAVVTETQTDSQPSQQQIELRPLHEISGNKRPLAEADGESQDRPPAKQRRTQASAFRKPGSMIEIRESLSFLLEEPDAGLVGPTVELDSELENADSDSERAASDDDNDDLEELERARQNDGGFAPNTADFDARAMPPPRLPASRRRTAAPAKAAVVDRLSLKRGSSASSDSALGRTAWAAPAAGGGFKAPSLLRRATTNTTSGAANDRGVTVGSASLSRENGGSGVKMGGSKKSSLAYQARAEERKAIVEASARSREENTARIAQMMRNSSVLGRGLTGRFE